MHSQKSIGWKLMAAFTVSFCLLVTVSAVAVSGFSEARTTVERLVDSTAKKVELASKTTAGLHAMLGAQRGVIMYTLGGDTAYAEAHRQQFIRSAGEVRQILERIRPLLVTDAGRELNTKSVSALNGWNSEFAVIVQRCREGRPSEAIPLARQTIYRFEEATQAGAELMKQFEQQLAHDKQTSGEAMARNRAIVLIAALLALIAGGTGFVFVGSSSRSLRQLAAELAEGADQIASASAQVSSSSQALSQGASEQAASLEETSASGEEINSMARKNAENSRTAAEVTSAVGKQVEAANRTLAHMISAMQEINTSSDKVSRIIKVIDGIAFQTNILALNAAVEAARAGDAGMGFAVVADEVRNLAQKCAHAAKDTSSLIEESITKTNEGKAKLDEVTQSIASITESAAKVNVLAEEVNLASQEQARGMDEMAKAIATMEQVTQKTAASAEEGAAAGEQLNSQASALRRIVDRLTNLVGSDNHVAGAARPPAKHRPAAVRSSGSNAAALRAAVNRAHRSEAQPRHVQSSPAADRGIPLFDEDFKAM